MAEPKTASLTVLGGPLAGAHCPLPESGTVTIGSSPGSTLVLDLPAVSPYHARIVVEADRITVHDTGSSRTVHVNDNSLEPGGTELHNGDILWLGTPGEEDVVMLQCILPRRPATPAIAVPGPLASGATPTPEIETVALWATEPAPQAQSEEPRVVDAAAVVEPGDELFAAATAAAESVSFADEAVVVQDAEVAPTVLLTGPGEVAEPTLAALPSSETVAFEPEAPYEPTDFAPPPAPAAPPVVVPPPAPVATPPPPSAPRPPEVAAKPPAPAPAPSPRVPREPRPAAPARPAARPPAPRHEPRHAPARAAEPAHEAAPATLLEPETPSSRRPILLAVGGFASVLALAGLGWLAWQKLGSRPAPAARPAPVARASVPALPAPTAAPEPTAEAATPEPVAAVPTPGPVAGAAPTPVPAQGPTPAPRPTPTPAAPAAAARPTPPPAATGPSPEELRAQQTAAQVQTLVGQAEAAVAARQYDAALSHLDSALGLAPGHERATSLRADAVKRRDLARRRFVPGRTVVDSEKTRKEKARGGLVGFDTDDKAPDFLGRIEFEMFPASGIEANDAWTLRVFVVNQGAKPIRVQGLSVGTTVNGAGSGGAVAPSVREIAPRQRALVAETTGTWRDGTTSWVAEATLTAPKDETLRNSLTWK